MLTNNLLFPSGISYIFGDTRVNPSALKFGSCSDKLDIGLSEIYL